MSAPHPPEPDLPAPRPASATPAESAAAPAGITSADVRKVARLARLAVPDDQVDRYRAELGAVLSLAASLRTLDLSAVEPMSSPLDAFARPANDQPGPTLPTDTLLAMAPETLDQFVKVPKVLGEGAA